MLCLTFLLLVFPFQVSTTQISVGDELYLSGRFEEAADHFERLLEQSPEDGQLLLRLGACRYTLEQFSEAEKVYRRALSVIPSHPRVLFGLGTSLFRLQRSREAIPYLEQGVKLAPRHSIMRRVLAAAYQAENRFYDAESLLRALVREDPSDWESWYSLGVFLCEKKYYREALEALETSLRLQPQNSGARTQRAIALAELGRRDEAQSAFSELLQEASGAQDTELLLAYARFLFFSGQAEAALPWIARATALTPESSKLRFWQARVLFQLGRLEEAAREAEQAILLSPQLPEARNLVLKIYRLLGRSEDAARQAAWLEEFHQNQTKQARP